MGTKKKDNSSDIRRKLFKDKIDNTGSKHIRENKNILTGLKLLKTLKLLRRIFRIAQQLSEY